MLLKTELKKARDINMLENLIDQTKRDLSKTFNESDSDAVVDDIINVNDWKNKTKMNQILTFNNTIKSLPVT